MKRLILFAFLFASLFTKAQVSSLPPPSTVMPFGLLDVRAFKAVGDSSTDNTAAFRACYALAGFLHTGVFIPSGNWVLLDSVIVPQRVGTWGVGGMINNNNELGSGTGELGFSSTNILMQGNDKSVFVVDPLDTGSIAKSNTGNTFKDIAIIYQGTTPTKNAGIRFVDGGSFDMYNVGITGFWDDVSIYASAYPSMVGCSFSNYAHCGVYMANSMSPDWGGLKITNTNFLTGKYSGAYAGLWWNGSGAFRMSNCEFNLTDLTHIAKYCVVLNNSATGPTQEIYFNNTSFSAFDSAGIYANNLAPNTKGIFVSNVYAYGPITDSCNQAAFQFGVPSGQIQQIIISNVTAAAFVQNKFGYQPPIIAIKNAANVKVSGVSHGQYYTGPDMTCVNCQTSTQAVQDLGINTGFQDANGQPLYTRIGSKFGLDFWVNDSISPGVTGAYGIRFFNGNGVVGGMGGDNVWNFGQGNTAVFLNTTPQIYAEKDTNGKVGIIFRNATAGAVASAALTLSALNASTSIFTSTSTFTPYKNLGISATNIWSSGTGNLNLLADGGAITINNLNQHGIFINSANASVGIDNSGATALFEVGGNIVNQATNGATGNMFAVRNNLIGNTSTGVSGTVAIYALSGFGINSLTASNTGVTYTVAAEVYIAGKPTASTNVTITNGYPLYIGAGTVRLAPTSTTDASLNIPSGTAPTSPNDGDIWYASSHLSFRLSGTTVQLDLPAPGTAGHIPVSDGTNWITSTPTFPNASATTGKVIKSDGTNWVASTETYATPGSSGNVMTSDGTNWTSVANQGGWTSLRVSGSDVTTTGQTLVDITGLVTGTLTASTLYEYEAVLYVTGTDANGNEYAVQGGGTGTAATVFAIATGTLAANTTSSVTIAAPNTATTAMVTGAFSGIIIIKGYIVTRSTGTPTLSIQHLKVTSGTSTVKIGSVLRYRLAS